MGGHATKIASFATTAFGDACNSNEFVVNFCNEPQHGISARLIFKFLLEIFYGRKK